MFELYLNACIQPLTCCLVSGCSHAVPSWKRHTEWLKQGECTVQRFSHILYMLSRRTWIFWYLDILVFSVLAFRPHVNGVFEHQKRSPEGRLWKRVRVLLFTGACFIFGVFVCLPCVYFPPLFSAVCIFSGEYFMYVKFFFIPPPPAWITHNRRLLNQARRTRQFAILAKCRIRLVWLIKCLFCTLKGSGYLIST